MEIDWDRICDFVFDTFGDDNAEMARYSLLEFGIDPDTRRPIMHEADCDCPCAICGYPAFKHSAITHEYEPLSE